MDPNNNHPLRTRALEIALSYNGQEEVPRGSNWGTFVEACLHLVGITYAASWCQAFAFRCYYEAAKGSGALNPMPCTAGVLSCWAKTDPKNHIPVAEATIANILPGYQFIYNHGKGLGHTGIVVAMHPDGNFETIEGNTDPGGSRNGYGVFKRTRNLKDKQLQGFIRY